MTFKRFDSEGVVVLLIDDDRTTMMLLSKVVVAMGATVLTASDGARGLSLAHEHKPTAIICDYHMTPVGGASFLAGLRNSSEDDVSKIPVIMFTAETDEATMAKLNLLGATECITKPFNPKGLSQTLYAVTHVCHMSSLVEPPISPAFPMRRAGKTLGRMPFPSGLRKCRLGMTPWMPTTKRSLNWRGIFRKPSAIRMIATLRSLVP